jgi:hypothetical protein
VPTAASLRTVANSLNVSAPAHRETSPFRTPSCPARAPRIRRGVPGVGGLPAERSGSERARSAGAAAPRGAAGRLHRRRPGRWAWPLRPK